MATTKVKKPSYKKYPKKPKASASIEVMERYIAKCKEIDKENARRKSDYEKALRETENKNKRKVSLQKQIAGISRKGKI